MRVAALATLLWLANESAPRERVSANGECRACHVDVAKAHASSRHGAAATNASFRASLETSSDPRDRAWCLACHAPRVGGDGVAEGVGCLSCHDGLHTKVVDGARCASCHEVGLPPSMGDVVGQRAQNTPREHERVGATVACAACHLEGHRWPGGHDAPFAKRALEVSVVDADGVLVVTLTVDRIGHAMPTGDPFRVLAVRACADEACDDVTARRALGRRLVGAGDVDTRPWPGRPAVVRVPRERAAFIKVALESTELGVAAEPRTILARVVVPQRQ